MNLAREDQLVQQDQLDLKDPVEKLAHQDKQECLDQLDHKEQEEKLD